MHSIKIALFVILLVVPFPSIVSGFYVHTGQADKEDSQPTQIIVKFKPDIRPDLHLDKGNPRTGLAEIDDLHYKYSVVSQKGLLNQAAIRSSDNPLKSVYLFSVDNGFDTRIMADDYAKLGIVEYAIPDYQVELYDTPNDSLYPHQWALNNTGQGYYHVDRFDGSGNDTLAIFYGTPDSDIDALEVFENPPDNTNTVVVAIVDTGIDWDHPDLASMIWNNPNEIPDNGIDDDHNGYVDDIVGWDFSGNEGLLPIWEDNDPTDTYGHGTHCAGIVAAVFSNDIGVAGVVPDAKIMGIKFYPVMTLSMGAMGIVYAADNGADVINMSWGLDVEIPVVGEALEYVASLGVVLVASAGNDGSEVYNFPASLDETIAVGATNSDDQVTSFSTVSDSISVCAPGLSILSLRGDTTDMYGPQEPNVHIIDSLYYLASGTSMSGPYVVAAAAYLRSVSPGLSHSKIRDILQTTADDILDPYGSGSNYPGWDMYSGYGRINLPAALAEAPLVRAIISSPYDFSIANGIVNIVGCADGTDFTEYVLEYSPGQDTTTWIEVTSSYSSVTGGVLGNLNCTGLEGEYILRLRVGSHNEEYVRIFVTDSAIAEITYPTASDTITGVVSVQGSALCEDFQFSVLEYGAGETPLSWISIDTNTNPISESLLGQWTTTAVVEDTYTIRLQVYSGSGLETSHEVLVVLTTPFTEPNGWTLQVGEDLSPSANYADVDKDGAYEIIVGTESTILFVNTDGTIQSTNVPEVRTADYSDYPIAVGRLDNDAYDDFVAVSADSMMDIFPSEGSPISIFIGAHRRVFLRDINGDGIDEIHSFVQPGMYSHYVIYNADGSEWEWCNGCTGPDSTFGSIVNCLPADLDGDGICEIYHLFRAYLKRYDTCGCFTGQCHPGPQGAEMAAVDIDGDGISEMIRYGSNDQYSDGEKSLWAIDENLQIMSGWPHNTHISDYWAMGMPMFGDLDEDGILEYVSVHPTLDHSIFRAWRIDGTPFLGDSSTNGFLASTISPGFDVNQVILCDVDGNGIADITSTVGPDVWSTFQVERISGVAATGEYLADFPMTVSMTNSTVRRNHTMGDINEDGYLDVVYLSEEQKVVFHEFNGVYYRADKAYCPMYAYNRRLNFTYDQAIGDEMVCGDINGSGTGPNISDLVYLVSYLFGGGPPPPEMWAADVNGDGGTLNLPRFSGHIEKIEL